MLPSSLIKGKLEIKGRFNTKIPFKTVRNTLCHLWAGDQLWYCFMNGIYDDCGLKGKPKMTMDELGTYWESDHENDGQWEQLFDFMDISEIFEALECYRALPGLLVQHPTGFLQNLHSLEYTVFL